uniref:Uncharacterized protein n=1 Tax=Chromera velia CCMP2878 TaxID=1169474 RepID=A0A0G4FX62_9ALVE|eukprot:Cvel_19080.t1-p1 / transcript=Cvel_19080.t1 / gene=Cvel_19080 / organism=Chromera_velia_CCMP2878 / gene_product=hypothetical protein / transcript_product=hypothetical protein / location=Cvel_scaffold1619:22229-23440(+) / protein_length=188 / sequence_SO=supercontig / SO=protein_coding / is_pseudo=false
MCKRDGEPVLLPVNTCTQAESGKGDNVPLYTSFLKTKASVDKKNKTLTGNVRRPIEDNQTASGRSGAELSDTTMWSNVSGPPPILVALQGTPAVPTVSYPSYDEKITRAFNTLEKFTDKANSQKMQSQARALEAQTNAEGVAVKPTDSVFCPPRVTSVGRFTGPEVANQRNVVALGKSYVSKGVPFRV